MTDFKMQILNAVFNLAGTVITQTMKTSEDKYEQLHEDYYRKTSDIAAKAQKEYEKEEKNRAYFKQLKEQEEEEPEYVAMPEKDLSEDKIEKGTACLGCSVDHFSTTSGALAEALRFARKEGLLHPEVQTRIGIASDELNIMERIDLSAEKTANMKGKEKQVALEALNASRDLRHKIKGLKTAEDLEMAAADAANLRTHFMKDVFNMAMKDGTVDKLCRNFTGEEKEKCMSTITEILEKKKDEQ